MKDIVNQEGGYVVTCAELEVLLADYVDGTLPGDQKTALESHLRECPSCAEFAADVTGAVHFMERAAEIAPPPDLVTRIAHQIPAGKAHAPAVSGLRRWFARYLQPVLQPRFAMGMAMTILSFSMLGRFAGLEPRQLKPADLNPVKVWQTADDKLYRSWQRAVKYYESLRVVYEIRSRLSEWTEQEEEDRRGRPQAPAQAAPPAQVAPPKSDSNRTNTK